MSSINFSKTYLLHEHYEGVKSRALQFLGKYLESGAILRFDDVSRSVTFVSENLIPTKFSNLPRVMLLFSNPHPHSILQGMFLSPNTIGRENPFWSVMRNAGWLVIPEEFCQPQHLADICFNINYQGPYELIFYCYYAFPTDYPTHIRKIFGNQYFNNSVEPQALEEFRTTIHETSVEAVVTFNNGIFNIVSEERVDRYINRLMDGELIQCQVKDMDRYIPLFLTYPTGWRYQSHYKQLREASLDKIKISINNKLNMSESQS